MTLQPELAPIEQGEKRSNGAFENSFFSILVPFFAICFSRVFSQT